MYHQQLGAGTGSAGTVNLVLNIFLGSSHAGAIVGGADDTAAAKMAIMRECGIHVVDSPAEIGDTMLRVLGGK